MPVLETASAIATIGSFCIEVPRVANGVRKFSDNTLNLAAYKVDLSFRTLECYCDILEDAEVDRCMLVYDSNKRALEEALHAQKSNKKWDNIFSYWKQRKSTKKVLRNAEDFLKLVNRTSMDARERHMRSKGKNTGRTIPGVGPAHENDTEPVDNQIPLQVINSPGAETSNPNSTERSLQVSLEEARALLCCPGCGSKLIPKSAYVELPSSPGSQKNHAGMMICDQCGISRLPPQHEESATAEDSNQT